nr:MAG TPA_asm: hypothetical protein [Caudoviricetes sp.]
MISLTDNLAVISPPLGGFFVGVKQYRSPFETNHRLNEN